MINSCYVKKQLKELPKKTSAYWHQKYLTCEPGYAFDMPPQIKSPEIFLGKELLDYDNAGKRYVYLWIVYDEHSGFEIYKKEYLAADIYECLDEKYETLICSTKSRAKAIKTYKQHYKKLSGIAVSE